MSELKAKIQRTTGERDMLQKRHNEEAERFKAANKEINTGKVSRGLLEVDADKFETAMNDMEMPKEEHNAWKMYDFLDKNDKEGPLDRNSGVKRLKKEVEKILQQNSDISAGL